MGQRTASVIRSAVRHVRRFGIDGQRPLDEIDALVGRDDLVRELERALRRAARDDLAATIHIVRLLRCFELTDCIGEVALQHPSSLDARLEAVDTISESGRDIPDALLETMTQGRDFLEAPDRAGLEVVLRFPEGWRDAVLVDWLARGGSPPVDLLQSVMRISSDLDLQVVRKLSDSSELAAAEVLQGLAGGGDRAMAKEARRGLHRLRGRGIAIAAELPAGSFSFEIDADVRGEARGWITGVDGFGGRVLWLLAPAPRGGDRLLEAVINDQEGLRKAELLSVTRKDFREHVERLRGQPEILIAQRPLDNLIEVLRQGERRASDSGRELPEGWQRWRREVGDVLMADGSPAAAAEHGADVPPDPEALRESVSLLGDPAFANWAVIGERAERAAQAVREAETSTLVIDEAQRKERIDEAMRSAATVFDDGLRARYRRRLEAMVEMLSALRRHEHARLASAAAIGFTEVVDLYSDHPFARALLQRGVLAAYQSVRQREGTDAQPSPIVAP